MLIIGKMVTRTTKPLMLEISLRQKKRQMKITVFVHVPIMHCYSK